MWVSFLSLSVWIHSSPFPAAIGLLWETSSLYWWKQPEVQDSWDHRENNGGSSSWSRCQPEFLFPGKLQSWLPIINIKSQSREWSTLPASCLTHWARDPGLLALWISCSWRHSDAPLKLAWWILLLPRTGKDSNTAVPPLTRLCATTVQFRIHYSVPQCKFISMCCGQHSWALLLEGALKWFHKGIRITSQLLQNRHENLYKHIAFHASSRSNLALCTTTATFCSCQ